MILRHHKAIMLDCCINRRLHNALQKNVTKTKKYRQVRYADNAHQKTRQQPSI